MTEATRYLMFYQVAEGFQAGAREHFPAHQARYQEFMRRGVLLAVGPFTDGGAMGVFTSRAAAEEFVRDDPFVINGVVSEWHVREWRQVTPE
ncbi:MAG TPA: YciI family protein [Trebonia sp.]